MPQNKSLKKQAFTLVEMIGVLAIIAVLAVVIAPKVFSSIRSSRVNSTMVSIDSYKKATTEFISKYGAVPTTNNNSRVDDLLIKSGLLDERFASKMGAQADVYSKTGAAWTRGSDGTWSASGGNNQTSFSRIICRTSNTNDPKTAGGSNFRLNGSQNMSSGARVVSAVLESVPLAEAQELSQRIDGDGLSTTSGSDNKGKVVYNTANSKGVTDVYVYMMHQ